MKVRQYTYFAISSATITGADLSRALDTPADRIVLAGSRSREPLRPPEHSWQLICDEASLTVDDQIAELIARLLPIREAVRTLRVGEPDVRFVFQVVRYFDHPDGEDEDLTPAVEGFEKLPGQHQLLGWHLDAEQLAFLVDIGAEIDVDEYG